MRRRPIVCLDMDGTCTTYEHGWQGIDVIPDPPVDGLFPWLLEVSKHFDVHVFSSRSESPYGIDAMMQWFMDQGKRHLPFMDTARSNITPEYTAYVEFSGEKDGEDILFLLYFPSTKPPAHYTLDDRAERFMGTWPSVEHILAFEPWHKVRNVFPEEESS